MRRLTALPALGLAGLVLLSGCGSFLGRSETDKPLPGKRVSILAVDRGLSADRAITDLDVQLPPPYVKWMRCNLIRSTSSPAVRISPC